MSGASVPPLRPAAGETRPVAAGSGPSRRSAYALLGAACLLPRLVVLFYERGALLQDFEKSHVLAQLYLSDGTFGYVPGHPSAYTQPLYGWFLIVVFWIAGFHWWSVGTAQLLVAAATSATVFETGRRFLSTRIGLLGAAIATLQPYLVWHDLHGNREILDQLLGAGLFGLALLAAARRSAVVCAALGAVCGLALLSNARLAVLPFVLCAFLAWRGVRVPALALLLVVAAVVTAPWVVRNKLDVGCFAITTDSRSLWKANNVNTYKTLAAGEWLDQVPDIPQRDVHPVPARWLTPEDAGALYREKGTIVDVPECAQESYYEHLVFQFWEHHPGDKAKLMAQATEMLWSPRAGLEGAQEPGLDGLRRWVEPIYAIPLFALAIAGLFAVPIEIRVLALLFALYETAAAWVFAGTTRYRIPWDFVLALLAAAALDRAWRALRARRAAATLPAAAGRGG